MDTFCLPIALPYGVRVGPLDYKVRCMTPHKAAKLSAGRGRSVLGICDPGTLTISLREDLPALKAAEVLMHEILHAIYDTTGLGAGEPETREECIVSALGYQLLQVWRDNPRLVAFFERVLRRSDEEAEVLPPVA